MHKLMEYICNELEDLERKAAKDGKLSMAEIEYVDKLAHIKKSLLSAEEMWEESDYSMMGDGSSYADGDNNQSRRRNGYSRRNGRSSYNEEMSYARGRGRNANRDSRGRYSSADGMEEMIDELRELMEDAPDNKTRQEFQRFIQKIEQM